MQYLIMHCARSKDTGAEHARSMSWLIDAQPQYVSTNIIYRPGITSQSYVIEQ